MMRLADRALREAGAHEVEDEADKEDEQTEDDDERHPPSIPATLRGVIHFAGFARAFLGDSGSIFIGVRAKLLLLREAVSS